MNMNSRILRYKSFSYAPSWRHMEMRGVTVGHIFGSRAFRKNWNVRDNAMTFQVWLNNPNELIDDSEGYINIGSFETEDGEVWEGDMDTVIDVTKKIKGYSNNKEIDYYYESYEDSIRDVRRKIGPLRVKDLVGYDKSIVGRGASRLELYSDDVTGISKRVVRVNIQIGASMYFVHKFVVNGKELNFAHRNGKMGLPKGW